MDKVIARFFPNVLSPDDVGIHVSHTHPNVNMRTEDYRPQSEELAEDIVMYTHVIKSFLNKNSFEAKPCYREPRMNPFMRNIRSTLTGKVIEELSDHGINAEVRETQ